MIDGRHFELNRTPVLSLNAEDHSVPKESRLAGVEDGSFWLCMGLVLAYPALMILVYYFDFPDVPYLWVHRWNPQWRFAFCYMFALHILLVCLSIYAGVSLWRKKSFAVDVCTLFFAFGLLTGLVENVALPAWVVPRGDVNWSGFLRAALIHGVGFLYLQTSVRSTGTFPRHHLSRTMWGWVLSGMAICLSLPWITSCYFFLQGMLAKHGVIELPVH